jgi:hypothetical protein
MQDVFARLGPRGYREKTNGRDPARYRLCPTAGDATNSRRGKENSFFIPLG